MKENLKYNISCYLSQVYGLINEMLDNEIPATFRGENREKASKIVERIKNELDLQVDKIFKINA